MFQQRSNFLSSIPPVTLNLIIINALLFLASLVFQQTGISLFSILGLHYFQASGFNAAQLITYMFLHANFTHLFFNMFSLYMFGRTLENVWGGKRFLIYYMVTGLGAAFIQEIVWWFQIQDVLSHDSFNLGSQIVDKAAFISQFLPDYLNQYITIGASGAVFGILLAFGMLFPNAQLYMMFIPVPIKAKYFVIGYGILELFLGVGNFSGDNVAHFAHLGGMIFGYILIKIWKKQDFNNGKYFY
ncbi:MAG: rhomboid family intramembrane serine protease [Bacteroidales bacterium]|nr:rhomboid family intramembrane serine protease [Bacteroidales bacterium]